jgi:hypothetical protein
MAYGIYQAAELIELIYKKKKKKKKPVGHVGLMNKCAYFLRLLIK